MSQFGSTNDDGDAEKVLIISNGQQEVPNLYLARRPYPGSKLFDLIIIRLTITLSQLTSEFNFGQKFFFWKLKEIENHKWGPYFIWVVFGNVRLLLQVPPLLPY